MLSQKQIEGKIPFQKVGKTKWMMFYETSNGNLNVFCDNLNCQRAIQKEINLAFSGLNYNSFLTVGAAQVWVLKRALRIYGNKPQYL